MKPFVYLVTGMSFDGKISNHLKEQSPIADDDDMSILYNFRINADAIMVGGNTLKQDDPGLSVKSDERRAERVKLGKSEEPIKVGVISDLSNINLNGSFFTKSTGKKIIFTTDKTPHSILELVKDKSKIFIYGQNKVDLVRAMNTLYELGIKNLMVEGGGNLIYSLFENSLIDEVNLVIGNYIIGGERSITPVEGEGFNINNYKKVKFKNITQLGSRILIKADVTK